MDEVDIAPALRSLFGGDDHFAVVRNLRGEVFRDMPGRRTLRFEHEGRRYFLKYHAGVGWGEIAKNLLTLKQPVLGAVNEVRAIDRLTTLGIPTMTRVAWGQRGWNPARLESFVITEALEGMESLEDTCKRWKATAADNDAATAMIGRLADVAARLHGGGSVHQDFYICHFLWPLSASMATAPWYLIDLHRMLQFDAVPLRLRVKDVAGLLYSLCEVSLYDEEARRLFEARYSDLAGAVAGPVFWRAVDRKLDELCRRGIRRGLLAPGSGVRAS